MTRSVFDSHFHIVDPRFPLTPNNGYLPPAFTVDDYLERTPALNITGGVVVSGSFQGFDQAYLVDALSRLGPRFVGVTNMAPTATDDTIEELAHSGVRAIRFNLYRGGSIDKDQLLRLSQRVADIAGMHTELYLDATALLDLEPALMHLRSFSIDHLGMSGVNRDVMLRLVAQGMRVKATGFGRVDLDVTDTLCAIHAENPTALMFGSDLPSTRARRPFAYTDVDLVARALGESALPAVLEKNARLFYRMPEDEP